MFMEKYIGLKKELNTKSAIGFTAFHLACRHGNSRLAEMLMKKCKELKIDLNAKDKQGRTGFHIAGIYRRNPEQAILVEQILDNAESLKINLTTKNCYGRTGFQSASTMGRLQVILLIRKKVPNEILKHLMFEN